MITSCGYRCASQLHLVLIAAEPFKGILPSSSYPVEPQVTWVWVAMDPISVKMRWIKEAEYSTVHRRCYAHSGLWKTNREIEGPTFLQALCVPERSAPYRVSLYHYYYFSIGYLPIKIGSSNVHSAGIAGIFASSKNPTQ